ncbi:hypothetical protein JHK84_045279 [Glycine max]|nr:hypothetical protein JHK86_045223 [Glycine max]KAG5108372.1 hypothetical protein JHK84_045279 [Glycine max]
MGSIPLFSGSARTGSKNVGFSATGKSQFSEIASGSDDREESLGRILKWPNLKVFSFEELISASRRFRYDIQGLVIGKGCFGPVYKGCLDENTLTPAKGGYGMAVAIKMFNQDYVRGFEEWQSDIYGFGVVLLEILTGMRALDTNRPQTMQNLVEWTKSCLSSNKKLKAIMDAKIEGQYSLEAAGQAAQLTLKCLKSVPEERPSMKDVVEALEAIEAIQNPQFAAYISSTPSAGS